MWALATESLNGNALATTCNSAGERKAGSDWRGMDAKGQQQVKDQALARCEYGCNDEKTGARAAAKPLALLALLRPAVPTDSPHV